MKREVIQVIGVLVGITILYLLSGLVPEKAIEKPQELSFEERNKEISGGRENVFVEKKFENKKTFGLHAKGNMLTWKEETNPILEVERGDQVTIALKSTKGTHNLHINGLGIQSGEVIEGETTTIEFLAETKGTYDITCANHEGIQGTLTIT